MLWIPTGGHLEDQLVQLHLILSVDLKELGYQLI